MDQTTFDQKQIYPLKTAVLSKYDTNTLGIKVNLINKIVV
jgi:hypothetical protein